MRSWSLIAALCLGYVCALTQQAPSVLRGTWTATEGPSRVLRGTWAGQASPHNPNVASGSWTLLDDAGEVLLQGTWSAQKTHGEWQGSWAARTVNGASFSGTWSADIADSSTKTFEDMLKRTLEKEVAGSWRSGRHQGNWWLKGSPSPPPTFQLLTRPLKKGKIPPVLSK